jgi:hypothetical protein
LLDLGLGIVGNVATFVSILHKLISFTTILENDKTVRDQIKDKVDATVLKTTTEYHSNILYFKLGRNQSRIENIVTIG